MTRQLKIGDIVRTPYPPGGMVRILKLEPLNAVRDFVTVEYIEDHPHGYHRGETGHYYSTDWK